MTTEAHRNAIDSGRRADPQVSGIGIGNGGAGQWQHMLYS
jgi:hypothetical protein